MSRIEVTYQGLRVGELAEARGGILFEYDAGFLATGHELSPLNLKLAPGIRTRDAPPGNRLPGLFEDSLPDQWGRRIMTEWFKRRNTPEHAITPLAMLAYVGSRGMGALTYGPKLSVAPSPAALSLAGLSEAARRAENDGPVDLEQFAQVGSSAGGARPKALIALPHHGTGPALAGAGTIPGGHEAWIVKFDTSRDGTHGAMEEAYARMARAAGLDMPATRLLETSHPAGIRRHFAVRRFDREGAERIHHHTLAAMCHAGAGDLNYETLLKVTRLLTRDEGEVLRAFHRAAFNVLAGNRDDHGKNHGFVYRNHEWKLGPAYDLTFVSPQQLPERGLAVAGERRAAGRDHLIKLADEEGIRRSDALALIDRVRAAVAQWRLFADAAQVPILRAAEVGESLRGQRISP
jgi:serine/threonine-protein kinase HipA